MSTSETTTASTAVKHRRVDIDGVEIFYREAGDPTNPTLLLLHGLPTSSRMFRNLIAALADRFHLVAPDYPGFGLNASRPPRPSSTRSRTSRRSWSDSSTSSASTASASTSRTTAPRSA